METQTSLFILFAFTVISFLIADLGFFNKKNHKVEMKSAINQSLFWVAISFAFGFLIYLYLGRESAAEFMSAYVTEKMLSVDNLFLIMLIFSYFKLDEKYHHRVLFYGILGAIIFRAIFIGTGALMINKFHWILYIFGVILIYTGFKLFYEKKEEHVDFQHNKILKLAKKYLPFTTSYHEGKFFLKEKRKFYFTTLFLIMLLIEATDIIFAVDSIPAAFAISQNAFIVFTSNIFAVLGLRALFFVIEGVLHKFHHLQKGLSVILVFIGVKMLSGIFEVHVSSLASFGVIMGVLALSLSASVVFPKKI